MEQRQARATTRSPAGSVASLLPAVHRIRSMCRNEAFGGLDDDRMSSDSVDNIERAVLFNTALEAVHCVPSDADGQGFIAKLVAVELHNTRLIANPDLHDPPSPLPTPSGLLVPDAWTLNYARAAICILSPEEAAVLARLHRGIPPERELAMLGFNATTLNAIVVEHMAGHGRCENVPEGGEK